MPATVTLADIYHRIRPELSEVEEEFQRYLDSRIDVIRNASHYLIDSGGKRIRPALLLLTTKLFRNPGPNAVVCAAIVELIHTATLIHDDIVDEADLRRGQVSMNRRWGNNLTVLLGDYLYIKSVSLALAQHQPRILEILCDVTMKMVEGELIQIHRNGKIDITEEEHLDIIRRKTAQLFSACCEIAAVISGATEEETAALRDYGMDLGMAFQLVDDVLDFTSSQKILGKPVVNDLKEGRLTLPLIYLLRKGNREHRDMIGTVLREHGFHSIRKEQVLDVVTQDGGLQQSMVAARGFGERARARLARFKDSEIREALLALPAFILERDR